MVLHDWGSALGFDWARQNEDRVAGLAFMEFITPIASWEDFPDAARDVFQAFRGSEGRKILIDENAFIERILPSGVLPGLAEEEMQHYRAPFLEPESREPVFRFPNEIPIAGEPKEVYEMAERYQEWLLESEVEKLMLWVEPGLLVREGKRVDLEGRLKRCRSVGVGRGNHYVQEDQPHRIGDEVGRFVEELMRK